MIELWRELSNELRVQVETRVDESPGIDLPVALTFTVTNEAGRPARDYPEILFKEVSLKVGVPPDWHVESFDDLSPGESKIYTHRCGYSDLPDLEYDLDGSVSPEAFFRIHRPAKPPGGSESIPASGYLKVFNEVQIHKWLTDLKC